MQRIKFLRYRGWSFFKRATILFVAAALVVLVDTGSAFAQILEVARSILHEPSLLTTQVNSGLYTWVTRAGNRLVAVGQGGRIILSDDNGKSWRQVETPTSVTLTHDVFVSPQSGWAVGQMGVVLHTSDGGEHWVMQLDGFQANRAILAAAQAEAAQNPPVASAANDLLNAKQMVDGGPSVPFLTLLPLSSRNLVLAGGFGMAFTSNDAGASWQPILNLVPNPSALHIYDIIKDGSGQLWVGEEGLVLLRDQHGNFKTLNPPFAGSFFGALRTANRTLILYGLQGTVLRSIDNGTSWVQAKIPSVAGIDAGIILKNGDVLLGDENGNLLLSRNDGQSYTSTRTNSPVVGLAQAADGSIITCGPQGMSVRALRSLGQSD